MNQQRDLDILLERPDDAVWPDSDDFTRALMARMRRRRRQRRRVFGAAVLGSMLVACVLMFAVPLPLVNAATANVRDLVAIMLVTALSGVAWIMTETITARRKTG